MRMAGIVASTLRRRTFRAKAAIDAAQYKGLDTGHQSPGASHPPSRSGSFGKGHTSSPPGHSRAPKRTKLFHQDFWPSCVNPLEQNLRLTEFETFDTLVPKANAWLNKNLDIHLLKCETIERKVTNLEEVESDNPMFTPRGNHAIYVKGLRLWYVYVYDHHRTPEVLENAIPVEIGYMNVIPKCLDATGKYPVYENLPETYAAINEYLTDSPLEGKILTIETVSLKLPRREWDGPEVDPDQTCFQDEYLKHVLYITRIYFIYGIPEQELIGAQDFLPDFLRVPRWYRIYGIYPKYRMLDSAMNKVKEWLSTARNIRITNIQTLEAVFRKHPGSGQDSFPLRNPLPPGNVHTGVNFVDKVESCAMIKFVRVTYVRPLNESIECVTMYSPPPGFSYKTFVPAAIKVNMCSQTPEYESFSATWDRAKSWMKLIDCRVISVESLYHPMSRIWHSQDGAETTVMQGEWTNTDRGEQRHKQRRQMVHLIRVYLDGEYTEPLPSQLKPLPQVEEVNDCRCTIM